MLILKINVFVLTPVYVKPVKPVVLFPGRYIRIEPAQSIRVWPTKLRLNPSKTNIHLTSKLKWLLCNRFRKLTFIKYKNSTIFQIKVMNKKVKLHFRNKTKVQKVWTVEPAPFFTFSPLKRFFT